MATREEMLASYFGRKRGGSNVYGGPQPAAAPPPPQLSAPSGAGGGLTPTQQRMQQNAPKKSGGGGGLLPSLGNLVGDTVTAIGKGVSVPLKGVMLGVEEFGEFTPLNPILDQDRIAEDDRSNLDKITDPEYGFGQLTKQTGNKWADRAVGLAGDLAFDPLTYVGGAATKTAKFTGGRAGREALALNLQRAKFAPEVVESAYKYGPAYLDDAARKVGGIGEAGVYFGLGQSSVKLPGSTRLGKAFEKGFAQARVNTTSRVAQPLNAKLRVVPELEKANRILMKGQAIDGVTVGDALETVAFHKDKLAGSKVFSDVQGRTHRKFLNSITENDAPGMTHAVEGGATDARSTQLRGIFQSIRKSLTDEGVDVGNLGENYVPHIWERDFHKFLREDPRGQAIARHLGIDPNADPGLLNSRNIRGGDVIDMPGGRTFKVPESGTIKDINEAIARQFPDAPKALVDDARQLVSLYTEQAARAHGIRRAWKNLTASGSDVVQRMKNVSVEELDELASLTQNQALKDLLEKQIKLKVAQQGKDAVTAVEYTNALRKSITEHLEGTVKSLGRDHADLRTELGDIAKKMKAGKLTQADVEKDFAEMGRRVQKQFDDTVKQLDEVEERIAVLRADQELTQQLRTDDARAIGSGSSPTGMGTRPGGPVKEGPLAPPSKADSEVARKIAEAERLQAQLDDQLEMATDAMERVDTLRSDLAFANYQMESWDRVVDSPQLLADEAAERAAVDDTVKVETWVPVAEDKAWSQRLTKAIDDFDDTAELERQAREASRAQAVVDASDEKIAVWQEAVVANRRARMEVAEQLGGVQAEWVPLSVRSRRKRLLDRLSEESETVAKIRKAQESAERRAERMRARSQRNVDPTYGQPRMESDSVLEQGNRIGPDGKPMKNRYVTNPSEFPNELIGGTRAPRVVAREGNELLDAEADLLLRQQAHNDLADDWAKHTDDLNNPKATTTAAERLQRQQLLEAKTEALAADDQVLVLSARRDDLLTRQAELQADLRKIADEEFADIKDVKASTLREQRAEATARIADLQAQLEDVERTIRIAEQGGSEAGRLRTLASSLDQDAAELYQKIANAEQTKRWHARLAQLDGSGRPVGDVGAGSAGEMMGVGPQGALQGPPVPGRQKNPIRQSNSLETLKAQREMVHRIERAEGVKRQIDESLTRMETRRQVPEYRTLGVLQDTIDDLEMRLAALPEPDYEKIPMRIADDGAKVSNEEADVIARQLELMANASKDANARYKAAKAEFEKRWPTENQQSARAAGAAPPITVTEEGVQLPTGRTLTREEYEAGIADRTVGKSKSVPREEIRDESGKLIEVREGRQVLSGGPVVGGKRTGSMQRGKAVGREVDETGELTGEGVLANVSDEAADLADQGVDISDEAVADIGSSLDGARTFDEQADALSQVGLDEDAALREAAYQEMKDLRTNAIETRKAYQNSLRAYGVKDPETGALGDVADGFAYGRWGQFLMVDTKPANPNAKGWSGINRENAIVMTPQELEEEVFKQTGKRASDFKGPRPHAQMAKAIGAKSKLYKPGTQEYAKLDPKLIETANRSAAREQVRRMNGAGRRAVLAEARSQDRMAVDRIMNERRLLQGELATARREQADVMQVALEAQFRAEEAAQRVASLTDDLGRSERVVAGVGDLQSRAGAARFQADQASTEAGVRRVQASGADQAREVELRVAQADKELAERRVEELAVVEERIGKLAADEINAVSTDRALVGERADRIKKILEDSKARQQRVKDIKKRVPAKLKQGSTGDLVKKQLDELQVVLDDAAAEGTPVSTVTAQLFDSATQASLAVEAGDVQNMKALIKKLDEAAEKVMDPKLSNDEKLAAIKGSPFVPVMQSVHDGFARIESRAFPEGIDSVTKQGVMDILNNVDKALVEEPGQLLRLYDDANRFFKTYATASPGFHVRNFLSASFMNLTEGVGFGQTAAGFREWRRYVKAGQAESAGDIGALARYMDGLDEPTRNALEATLGSGAGGHFEAAELGARGAKGKLLQNPVTNFSRHVGADMVEGPARLALALHYTQRGGGIQEAMGAITRIHFDYSQLSNFDRKMKRIIPFWTFMSRNLPLQFEQMVTRPRAYSQFNSVMRNLDAGEEGEGMPEWLDKMGAVTVARNVPFFGGRDMVFAPDLPHVRMEEEANKLFPNPTALAESVSPFLRVPFELSQNRSAFTGRDLFDQEAGEGGGVDQIKYFLENVVPPLSVAKRLTGQGTAEGKAFEKQLNYIGLPFKSVSDEQRKFALERAAGG